MVYIYNGILRGDEKERNLAFCNHMDGTGGYYAKQNTSVRERHIAHDFTHMWNFRNLTDDHRGREGKIR